MPERIDNQVAQVPPVLRQLGELYESFLDSLDEQRANDAAGNLIRSELDNIVALVLPKSERDVVDRLIGAATPPFGDRPDADTVARMAELFAKDGDIRSLASRRGYDPDLVRDLLRERLLPNRG